MQKGEPGTRMNTGIESLSQWTEWYRALENKPRHTKWSIHKGTTVRDCIWAIFTTYFLSLVQRVLGVLVQQDSRISIVSDYVASFLPLPE